ncbi:MAG: hypothetical protein GY803_03425 [Chloroflexi bacterium]|nr:hypothetical protein [Chloroflexota bacterium]
MIINQLVCRRMNVVERSRGTTFNAHLFLTYPTVNTLPKKTAAPLFVALWKSVYMEYVDA